MKKQFLILFLFLLPLNFSVSNLYAGFEPMLEKKVLNLKIDPCTDFYQYACGGWEATHSIPPEKTEMARSFTTIDDQNLIELKNILKNKQSHQKLKMFYSTCMDEAKGEKLFPQWLKQELEKIENIGKEKNLTQGISDLILVNIDVLFHFYPEINRKNATQMIASIGQGGLGLPNRDYYLSDTAEKKRLREQYQQHIIKMLEISGLSNDVAIKGATFILAFETKLAKYSLSPEELRDPVATYHAGTVDQLKKDMSHQTINWEQFFATVKISVENLFIINIREPEFFRGLDLILAETSLEQLKIYFRWHFLHTISEDGNKKIAQENFSFYENILNGRKSPLPRWKLCVKNSDSLLQDLLGQSFVNQTFKSTSKAKSYAILKNIQQIFRHQLANIDWMDEATKKAALDKLNTINNKIGYPDRWKKLDGISLSESSHLSNILQLVRYWREKDFVKIGKPIDKTEWGMTVPTVNAYYDPEQNEIVFPAGILQPPFFHQNAPDAHNYGAIGMVIGHELTHGFDDQGRQFDAQGNLKDWWSPAVAETFKKKSECLVEQYSHYKVGETPLNGKLTLGENIADLGGLKLAYAAYRFSQAEEQMKHKGQRKEKEIHGLSPEQQFFVAYGQSWCGKRTAEYDQLLVANDPHSPYRYRVNGVVANLSEFAEAFHCAVGNPMAPANRCSLW